MDLLKKLMLEMAIKEERKLLPEFKEFAKLKAEQMAIYHNSLINAGFNSNQALSIVKEHGVDVGRISWIIETGGDRDGD